MHWLLHGIITPSRTCHKQRQSLRWHIAVLLDLPWTSSAGSWCLGLLQRAQQASTRMHSLGELVLTSQQTLLAALMLRGLLKSAVHAANRRG